MTRISTYQLASLNLCPKKPKPILGSFALRILFVHSDSDITKASKNADAPLDLSLRCHCTIDSSWTLTIPLTTRFRMLVQPASSYIALTSNFSGTMDSCSAANPDYGKILVIAKEYWLTFYSASHFPSLSIFSLARNYYLWHIHSASILYVCRSFCD